MKANLIPSIRPSSVPFAVNAHKVGYVGDHAWWNGFDGDLGLSTSYPTVVDFNSLFYYGGRHLFDMVTGIKPGIRKDVAEAIGGYPRSAVLYGDDGMPVVSLLGKNYGMKTDFGEVGKSAYLGEHGGTPDLETSSDHWRKVISEDWFDSDVAARTGEYGSVDFEFQSFDLKGERGEQWYMFQTYDVNSPIEFFFAKGTGEINKIPAYEMPDDSLDKIGYIHEMGFESSSEKYQDVVLHSCYTFISTASSFLSNEFSVKEYGLITVQSLTSLFSELNGISAYVSIGERSKYEIRSNSYELYVVPTEAFNGSDLYTGKNLGGYPIRNIAVAPVAYWAVAYENSDMISEFGTGVGGGTSLANYGTSPRPIFLRKGKYRVLWKFNGPIYALPEASCKGKFVMRRTKQNFRNARNIDRLQYWQRNGSLSR